MTSTRAPGSRGADIDRHVLDCIAETLQDPEWTDAPGRLEHIAVLVQSTGRSTDMPDGAS